MKYRLSYTLITRTTGFLSRTIFHFRKTELDIMRDYLKEKRGKRILDYGCNTGYFLNMIQKKYPENNLKLCGADINPHALEYARDKYTNFNFFEINEQFFSREKFDVIILSHVLEHIHTRDELIENLKKILNPDGELIIAIPQERFRGDGTLFQWAYNILRFRFENPHVVKTAYADLFDLLNRHNLEIFDHIYTHYFPPFKTKKRRIDSWSLVVRTRVKK